MTWMTALQLAAGLVLLVAGGEWLVRCASRLALSLGVSALVVGLTVVAFGTSAPELIVSTTSALAGRADIALGNVVGSNVFNILFILGASAVIVPLVVAQQLVRIDVPIMIGAALLVLLLGLDGTIGRRDGLLLLAGLVAYTLLCVRSAKRESAGVVAEYEGHHGAPAAPRATSFARLALGIAGGLAVLVGGSRLFVDGAVGVARSMGVSELVIGLTIVAAGTSLPEVVTSLVAAVRGERDIAVGNVVGSSIFNVLGVLGASAVIAPAGVAVAPAALDFDVPVMIAASVACLPILFTGWSVARWEGAVLLGYYAAYTTFLILDAQEHDALPHFSRAMLAFVVPLTGIGLGVSLLRTVRREGRLEPERAKNDSALP